MHTAVLGLEAAGLLERRPQEPEGRPRSPDEKGPQDPRGRDRARPRDRADRARRAQPQGRARGPHLARRHHRHAMTLEQRIRSAEADLFATVGAEVEESFHALAATGVRVRLLSHGSGPPLALLHGVSLSAAAWAPLFAALSGPPPARGRSPRSRAVGSRRLPTWTRPSFARATDRRHLRRARARRGAGRRTLAGRHARAVDAAAGPSGSPAWSRSESRRSPFRVSACGCRCRCSRCPASGRQSCARPVRASSIDACSPRALVRRGRRRAGATHRGAASLSPPARERRARSTR